MEMAVSTLIYRGMDWSALRNNSRRAQSDTTGGTYVIEPGDTHNLWTLRFGFPSRQGKPFVRVGKYASPDLAVLIAERHDYTFWINAAGRTPGQKTAFLGSGEQDQALAHLDAETVGEIADIILDNAEDIDARHFTAAASFFPAQKTGLKQEKNGALTLTLSVSPDTMPRWLLDSPPGTEVLFGAMEMATPQQGEWEDRGKQALKRAFVLPADPSFQQWIMHRYDKWRLVSTAIQTSTSENVEKATEETLRRLIACPSRRQIARNRDAIERLESIDREYYADLQRGFGAAASSY